MKVFSENISLLDLQFRKFNVSNNDGSNPVPLLPEDISVNTITRDGQVVTVKTNSAHGLRNGQPVIISGANQVDYNGTFNIVVTGADTFTYRLINGREPATPATGSIVIKQRPKAQMCIIIADENNTDDVTVGPDEDADMYTLEPGDGCVIEVPRGARFSIGDWYFDSAGASQSVKVLHV